MSNSVLFLKSGFPRAHLANGIGRYVGQLQRVTLKFCKSNGSSRGMRDFIENDLLLFARQNPGTVIYLKPRRHRTPALMAEYLCGEHHYVPCHNYTREEIIKWMALLRTQEKDGSAMRYRKYWHTEFPSIQGPWTPFTFRDPKLNLVEFPNEDLGRVEKTRDITATEKLRQLFAEQQNVLEISEEFTQRGPKEEEQ